MWIERGKDRRQRDQLGSCQVQEMLRQCQGSGNKSIAKSGWNGNKQSCLSGYWNPFQNASECQSCGAMGQKFGESEKL